MFSVHSAHQKHFEKRTQVRQKINVLPISPLKYSFYCPECMQLSMVDCISALIITNAKKLVEGPALRKFEIKSFL